MGPEIGMETFNKIWKAKFGRDMTEEEAWGMVEFIRMVMEHADKKLDEALANANN